MGGKYISYHIIVSGFMAVNHPRARGGLQP